MDLEMAITGGIIIAVCFIPFIIMNQNRKIKEKKTLQKLVNIAKQQNCNISKHETCGNFVIGIDEAKTNVFFLKQLKDNTVEQHINLEDIRNCKVKSTARLVKYKNDTLNVIDKLELCFMPFDKNKKEVTLEFYNTDFSSQFVGEVQSAEYWSKYINNCLKK